MVARIETLNGNKYIAKVKSAENLNKELNKQGDFISLKAPNKVKFILQKALISYINIDNL